MRRAGRIVRVRARHAAAALLALVTLGGAVGPARAGLPPYAEATDPLATSPSTDDGSFGAWHNPAQWGVPEREFADVAWFRDENDGSVNNWSLSMGRGLGLAVRRTDATTVPWRQVLRLFGDRNDLFPPSGVGSVYRGLGSVTDWQIGVASGAGRHFGGVAWGFSGAGKGAWERENYLSVGEIHRPNRYLSLGLSGRWAPSNGETSGLLDAGIRPLGDPRVLLFGDYALARGQSLGDGTLGGGVRLQPLPGIEGSVRWDEHDRFRFDVGLTLMRFGVRVSPRFEDGRNTGTWYTARSKPPLRGVDIERRAMRNRRFLEMDLHGRAVYQSYRWFDADALPLRDLTERIRFAKEDPTVGGIAIRLSGFRANITTLWELRQSLSALRAAGKKVLISCDNLDQRTYYLACVADHLTIDPIGLLTIPGVQASRTYMKDLLGKLGIGFDEWRYYKYKSAMESLSRTSFSDADREQFDAIVRATYEELASGIAASGRTTREEFDRIVNEEPILTASRLKELGWVDGIGRWDDLVEKDVERFGGRGKPMSYATLRDRRWQPDETWGPVPTIGLVYLVGECAMDAGIQARDTAPAMKRLRENREIDAVVLRVDSPGGDALASDLVAAETRKLKKAGKPTLVSQGRVAGSGGYWISMDADDIAAGPFTITGSIGVIGGWAWNDGFGRKTGLASDHVQVGKSADLLGGIRVPLLGAQLPERNLDEAERRLVEGVFQDMYGTFTRQVAEARGLDLARVRELAEGRIYDGRAAVSNGLVDRVATLEETIDEAKRRAGIAPGRHVRFVEVPARRLFAFPSLEPSLRSAFALPWKGPGGGAPAGAFGHSDTPSRLFEAGVAQQILDHPGRPLVTMPGSLLPLEEEPVR